MPTSDEDEGIDDVRGRQHAKFGDEEEAEREAEHGGKKPGPPAAERRRDQDRRQEKQIGGLAAQGSRPIRRRRRQRQREPRSAMPPYRGRRLQAGRPPAWPADAIEFAGLPPSPP